MRIAVVTANMGGMDELKPFAEQSIQCERIYITDNNSPFPFIGLDDRRKARYFKLQAHKIYDHDVIVWLDGSVEIESQNFVYMLLDGLKDHDIVIGKHPDRKNIYQEAAYIVNQVSRGDKYLSARYNAAAIKNEAAYYRALGLPETFPLYACGIFARINTNKVNAMFDDWWNRDLQWANFDQNSFSFTAWRHQVVINGVDWLPSIYKNNYFKLHAHKKLQ